MKNENFEKLFIGRDEVEINKKFEKWNLAIRLLKCVAEDWETVFAEKISVTQIINILAKPKISDFLKSHFVLTTDSPLSEGVRNGMYKLEAIIPSFNFPDFEELKNSIINLNVWIEQNNFKAEIENELESLFVNDEFVFFESLKESIREKFTFYTKSPIENKALNIVQSVCLALNSFNEIGIPIMNIDLPRPLAECLITTSGLKTFAEVGSGASRANYKLPVLAPDPYIFAGETPTLILQLQKNEN